MTTPRPDPRVGTTLGPYRIERVIGRGGMGVVYLAEQASLGRKVALKVLAPDLVDEEAFRQRFVRESQMAAAIEHPNILPIYEAGEIDGVYFLAMRYVEGTDLDHRLRTGPLEPREVVQLLAQVASALDAAGEAGLVHRDVKPANILIAPSRGIERADHAYLTDFGLTKHRGSQSGLTQSGAFMGTLDYIAPEQVEGRDVDGRTDQYSLACVAFQSLTGATPFPRDTDIAIAMAHLHDPPPSVSALRPEVGTDVDVVIARGMAKKPDDRYPTSEAFVGALRQALGVRPSEPHPMPEPAQAGEGRRRAVVVGIVGVVAVAALVGVAMLLTQPGGVVAPGSSPGTSPGTSPGASASESGDGVFPTAAESALIARLPAEMAADCDRGSYAAQPSFEQPISSGQGTPAAGASVVCTLAVDAGAQTVYLQTYPATDAGTAFLRDRLDVVAAQGEVPVGDCATKDQALGQWDHGDVLCYQRPDVGRAWIYWTDPSIGLLAAASREDLDEVALYDWWASAAKAIHAEPGSQASQGPTAAATADFPTLLEASLVLSLPTDSDPDCQRGDDILLPTRQGPELKPRAHVSCTLLGGQGPDAVDAFLLPFTDFFAGADVIIARQAAAGIHDTDCEKGAATCGGWAIEGGSYGAYLCIAQAGGSGAEFVWSSDEDRAIYRATSHDGDCATLLAWWTANREAIRP